MDDLTVDRIERLARAVARQEVLKEKTLRENSTATEVLMWHQEVETLQRVIDHEKTMLWG